MGFVNNAYIILIILPVYLTGAVQNGVVFTVAISLCYLLASKGAAFTSFKLSLLTLAFPQREFLFCFFLRLLFSSRILFLQTDSYILSHLIYPLQYHVALVLLYILRPFNHLILLYSHNTLLPKNVYFHTYISNLHVYQKSSMLIFPSSIP